MTATEHITEIVRRSPLRWTVTLLVANPAGARESRQQVEVNAPDQLSAAATALLCELDHIRPARWSEVHITIEPVIPKAS